MTKVSGIEGYRLALTRGVPESQIVESSPDVYCWLPPTGSELIFVCRDTEVRIEGERRTTFYTAYYVLRREESDLVLAFLESDSVDPKRCTWLDAACLELLPQKTAEAISQVQRSGSFAV